MRNNLNLILLCGTALLFSTAVTSCRKDDISADNEVRKDIEQKELTASFADGLRKEWEQGDAVTLSCGGESVRTEVQESGATARLSGISDFDISDLNPVFGVCPAAAAVSSGSEGVTVSVPASQTAGDGGYDASAAVSVARSGSDRLAFATICGGIKLNFNMSGITMIELESVDGYPLAGEAEIRWDESGNPTVTKTSKANSILTFKASDESGFASGKDWYISTLPCDLYGGYRLSIYRDGLVAHYFGVHQRAERACCISPADLIDSELEFDDPDAPLVEEERPELDATTSALLRQYQKNPTEENRQALLDQMGLRYDKVVARKKAKLRELEREAKTTNLIDEMQAIVDEMVTNREIRLEQQFLRLIDPRQDDDPDDEWMVLRGASPAYIGYAPVTNAEYAAFNEGHSYAAGEDDYPVVNVTIAEAEEYCGWLTEKDSGHLYRLPTDEEWILGAGHMPKDVTMNSGHVETGLTAVDAYAQTTGACGGIDFWGNSWEWTCSTDSEGRYVIKGGSWDSDRDDCRSEKSDVTRDGAKGYDNVGFRVVRTLPAD